MPGTGTDCTASDRSRRSNQLTAWIVIACLALALGGCSGASFSQVYQRGYVLPEGALEQIPMGASQEQVLIVLGTPSTVATVSGEVFYYISQRGVQSAARLAVRRQGDSWQGSAVPPVNGQHQPVVLFDD